MVLVFNYHLRKAYGGLTIKVHAPISSALDVGLRALAALLPEKERPVRIEK